ncbi:MAG: hypothetical protein GXP49_03510 [Deltaproteobacteria bacterium]|nr:hypothetical protein [Deltaproteobacteria bacterium]
MKTIRTASGYILSAILVFSLFGEAGFLQPAYYSVLSGLLWTSLFLLFMISRGKSIGVKTTKSSLRDRFKLYSAVFLVAFLGIIITRWTILGAFPIDTDDWFFVIAGHRLATQGLYSIVQGISDLQRGGIFLTKVIPFIIYSLEDIFLTHNYLAWRLLDIAFLGSACVLVTALGLKLGLDRAGAALAGLGTAFSTASHEITLYSSRMDIALETTFLLGSLLFFIDYMHKEQKFYYISSLILFIAALLTQETAMIFPLIIVAIVPGTRTGTSRGVNIRKLMVTLTPFLILSGLFLWLSFTLLQPGQTSDLSGAAVDQRTMILKSLFSSRLTESYLHTLPRFLAVPFPSAAFGRPGYLITTLSLFFLGIILLKGMASKTVSQKVYPGLFLSIAISFAPTFFLAALPDVTMEQTRHFFFPVIFFYLFIGACLGKSRSGKFDIAGYVAFLFLLVFNVSAVIQHDPVNNWFSKVLARTSYKISRQVSKMSPGQELYLVTDTVRIDRGGMDSAVLSVFLDKKPKVKLNYLSGVGELTPRDKASTFFTINADNSTIIMAWDPKVEDFIKVDLKSMKRLLGLQESMGGADCERCSVIDLEFPTGKLRLKADLLENVWLISIVNRS